MPSLTPAQLQELRYRLRIDAGNAVLEFAAKQLQRTGQVEPEVVELWASQMRGLLEQVAHPSLPAEWSSLYADEYREAWEEAWAVFSKKLRA